MARKVVPEKVEEAREKIISATMDLIIEDGFSKLNLSNVASKVGITKAAIYWYFSSKEELVHVVASSYRTKFIDSAKQIASLNISPKQKIEAYLNALEHDEARQKCFLLIKVFLEVYATNDEIMAMIQAGYKEYMEIVQEIFDEAIRIGEIQTELSSQTLAKLLAAILDGCTIHNEMLGGNWLDFGEVKRFYMSIL